MTNIKTVLSGVVNVQLETIKKLNRVNDNLVSGYYTKAETHQVIASSGFLQKEVSSTEPVTAKENTIYFIPSGVSIQVNKGYKQYIKINNQWCKIGGDEPPDLTPYVRKDQTETISATLNVQNLNVIGAGSNNGTITTNALSANIVSGVTFNSTDYKLNNNNLNTSGGLVKVEANGYVPSSILDPLILGKIDNITLNNGSPQQIVNKTVNLNVIEQPLSAVVGQYLQKTASGWVTAPGISTVQQQITSVTDNKIQVRNTTIPVMLKTNKGNIYPIQKNVLTQSGTYFYIDIRPFLVYDNSASFTGTWKVYFGAGVAQRNTNIVYSGVIVNGIYNANYDLGDIHNISVSGATQLQVSNIPLGQGLSIRIHNNGNNLITFGASEIINSSGQYIVPFGNFNNKIELIGGAIQLF